MLNVTRILLCAAIRSARCASLTIAVVFGMAQAVPAYETHDCVSCHDLGSTESHLQISIHDLKQSVHGDSFTCSDCHSGIVDDEHSTTPGSGYVDCSQCHDQKNLHGLFSNSENRPQCYHCHTKHRILSRDNKQSSVFAKNLHQTCSTCHSGPCGLTSALSWLPSLNVAWHKKGDFSQSYTKDNCIGCHQGAAAHGDTVVLDDQVCHVCHAPLGEVPLLAGHIHVRAQRTDQPLSFAAGIAYVVVLALLVLGGIRFWFFRSNIGKET